MPKLVRPPQRPTHPLIWCLAAICAFLAVAVVITGVVVFIGYMVIHPRVPQLSVSSAKLDHFEFDQTSLLIVRVIIILKAENDNEKATASFYETEFDLFFEGQKIAILRADPFDVGSNRTLDLHYEVESKPIPLEPQESDVLEIGVKQNELELGLTGHVRTRWRVGPLGSVKFWLRLHCKLVLPVDESPIYPKCTTRSK
ncbi:hypothetical protein LIER_26791 [Lithospermum erythrorhizon]|uniref:Late embryogenesis abundant protein LEA-2 subgroup domain-containing protein n=1 Tax=Lithospermum erythrorhizon TaxID=34254 RepID=A0AAV3RD22_LITER